MNDPGGICGRNLQEACEKFLTKKPIEVISESHMTAGKPAAAF